MMNNIEQWISKLEVYSKLTKQEQKIIADAAYIVCYEKGQLIHTPSRDCLGILIVISGVLRTYLLSEEGKKATIYRLKPGEICILAMSCVMPTITFDVEVEAEEACELLVIPTVSFRKLYEHNLLVENYILNMITRRFSYVMEGIQQLLFMTLEQRIITFLLEETKEQNQCKLRITKEQLAENIGSAREAVSRVLGKLQTEGLIIVTRGKIELPNKEALEERL